MMKRTRVLQLATAVAVGLLALSGCSAGDPGTSSSSGAPAEKGEIGFFSVSNQIPVFTALSDQVTDYMEGEGYTVKVYDAAFDPSQQAQQISEAVNTGSIQAAWIFPVSLEALAPSLDLLQSKQVPAVLIAEPGDFDLEGAQPGLIFSTGNYEDFGKAIGEQAVACVAENGGNEALLLQSVETSGGSADIIKSIQATFEDEVPDVPIVDTTQAPDIATAQTNVSQLLIAHPDADVILAGTDETALGAIGAYQAAGKTPTCVVAGGGGAPDVLAAQEAGQIYAAVALDYVAGVEDAAPDLVRLIGDPTSDGGLFATPISVVN